MHNKFIIVCNRSQKQKKMWQTSTVPLWNESNRVCVRNVCWLHSITPLPVLWLHCNFTQVQIFVMVMVRVHYILKMREFDMNVLYFKKKRI